MPHAVLRQYGGEFQLANGGSIYLRCSSNFNLQLWDEVMAPFQPLTAHDMLLISWGGWSLRYNIWNPGAPWEGWKQVGTRACSAPSTLHTGRKPLQPGLASACMRMGHFPMHRTQPSAAWLGLCMHACSWAVFIALASG